MLSEQVPRPRRSLAFRLTLWYAGIFTLTSLTAFLVFYVSISTMRLRQTDEELSKEIAEFSSLFASRDMNALKELINIEAAASGVEQMFLRMMSTDGKELSSSNMSSWHEISINTDVLRRLSHGAGNEFETQILSKPRHKVRVVYGLIGPGMVLQIGQSLEDDEAFLAMSRKIYAITLTVLMAGAGLIGWFLARRALQGVEEVTRTALAIAGGALEKRVSVKSGGDEIDRLTTTFNTMLDRIHVLVTGMREMTDNIAHDLRSPITRIRGTAELALTTGGSKEEYESMAASTMEECDRLLEMINTMLDITEFEAGAGKFRMEDIDLSILVRDACELFQPIAEDKSIAYTVDATPGKFVVGDEQRLQRMIANILDNALKYTPPRGIVDVSVRTKEDKVIISVRDTGIGISEKDLPNIFKRFYRGDRSRSQAGTGLGLSLAQAVASAHGGSITVESVLGKGSTFMIVLPHRHQHS
jgi:heavy metal sensor kinase